MAFLLTFINVKLPVKQILDIYHSLYKLQIRLIDYELSINLFQYESI